MHNLWDAAKVLFKGTSAEFKCLYKKRNRSQINNLIFYLKKLEKVEQTKPKQAKRRQ